MADGEAGGLARGATFEDTGEQARPCHPEPESAPDAQVESEDVEGGTVVADGEAGGLGRGATFEDTGEQARPCHPEGQSPAVTVTGSSARAGRRHTSSVHTWYVRTNRGVPLIGAVRVSVTGMVTVPV